MNSDKEKDLLSFIEDECEHFFSQATVAHATQAMQNFNDISEHVYYASDMLELIDDELSYKLQDIISTWKRRTLKELGERA